MFPSKSMLTRWFIFYRMEQELKKLGPWKSQLELQKKQIAEVQAKLDDERKRADKFEFQHKTLHDKFETLSQEKEVSPSRRWYLKELFLMPLISQSLTRPRFESGVPWDSSFDRLLDSLILLNAQKKKYFS